MGRYLLRRAIYVVPILFGVTLVVFAMIKMVPGDAATVLAGPGAPPEVRAALSARLGLDQPVWQQYLTWLGHALQGDFGQSISRRQDVSVLLAQAFKNTFILTAFAMVVSIVFGGLLGALGALRHRSPLGRTSSALSTIALSTPQYSFAVLLVAYFGVSTQLFPVSGMHTTGRSDFGDLMYHLVLPGLTAALVPTGIIAKQFAVSLREVLGQDFIDALRARGVSGRRVFLHALHNTLPSLLTIAGLQIGYLLGGVVFVEAIFAWPGVGLSVFQAIGQRDLPVIQAGVLLSAFAFVVLNYSVDAVHAAIDPRVRAT